MSVIISAVSPSLYSEVTSTFTTENEVFTSFNITTGVVTYDDGTPRISASASCSADWRTEDLLRSVDDKPDNESVTEVVKRKESVGTNVGANVGSKVGSKLGYTVGATVGAGEGAVGSAVGTVVGSADGE